MPRRSSLPLGVGSTSRLPVVQDLESGIAPEIDDEESSQEGDRLGDHSYFRQSDPGQNSPGNNEILLTSIASPDVRQREPSSSSVGHGGFDGSYWMR